MMKITRRMSMTELIFVYGTLLTGEGNWSHYLKPAIGTPDKIDAKLKMVSFGGFPGVVKTSKDFPPIIGELFEVDDETLLRVDGLEGHPNWYVREQYETVSGKLSWIYIYPKEQLLSGISTIESSSWLDRD